MIKVKENIQNESFNFPIRKYRPEIQIINSDSLKKSLEILSKFDYTLQLNNTTTKNEVCQFCQNLFPVSNNQINCELCSKNFCAKHRQPLNHNCTNLNPNHGKYLMAKNLFRERLKEMKYKRR